MSSIAPTVLRVVVDPLGIARVTADGSPVWCVPNAAEAEALCAHARLLGVASAVLSPDMARIDDRAPWRSGCVVSLGLSDSRTGDAYARLTGRRHIAAEDEEALARHDDVAVVLLLASSLTESLLRLLYELNGSRASAPGLIFASDELQLASASRRFALGAHALPATSIGRAVIDEFLGGAEQSGERERLCGTTAAHEHVLKTLGEGAAFLAIEGHSDGIHLSLPAEGMLCPVSTQSTGMEEQSSYCAQTRCCPRYAERPSLDEAWAHHGLVAPKAVAARVLFNGGCYAFRVNDGVLGVRHSLACSLAEQAHVLAVVGAWQNTLADPRVSDKLQRLLASGLDVGEAVQSFNSLDVRQRTGRRLALLGDPLCRPSGFERSAETPVAAALQPQELVEDAACPTHGFLRHCVNHGLDTSFFCDEDAGLAVEDGIEAAVRAHIEGREPSEQFKDALLRYFSSFGRLDNAWGDLGSAIAVDEHEPCPHCGSLCVRLLVNLSPNVVRHSSACPRCGEVENYGRQRPPAVDFRRISEGVIRLAGTTSATAARVSLVSRYMPESVSFPWPTDPSGALRETFEFPNTVAPPAGPMACRVLFTQGLDISLAAVKVRAQRTAGVRFVSSVTT